MWGTSHDLATYNTTAGSPDCHYAGDMMDDKESVNEAD